MNQFFGKYRGKVVKNIDPLQQGRIQISCPQILGDDPLSWAMPCTPYAGPGVGFFTIPPIGANVWVEFEEGDPSNPIWVGCYWDEGQLPASATSPDLKVLKTDAVTLSIDDTRGQGGVTLEVTSPAVSATLKISLTQDAILLSHGTTSIELTPVSVSLNGGALEVLS